LGGLNGGGGTGSPYPTKNLLPSPLSRYNRFRGFGVDSTIGADLVEQVCILVGVSRLSGLFLSPELLISAVRLPLFETTCHS
jgi:hypothetical protein